MVIRDIERFYVLFFCLGSFVWGFVGVFCYALERLLSMEQIFYACKKKTVRAKKAVSTSVCSGFHGKL